MRDIPIIASGLAAFVALVTLPFWYNAMAGQPARLELTKPAAARKCVAPVDVMRRTHMEMLIAWRDRSIRGGTHDISLTHTCLEQCHGSKTEFCDRCHTYVGLQGPDCWSCHSSSTGFSLSQAGRLPMPQTSSLPHTERSRQ